MLDNNVLFFSLFEHLVVVFLKSIVSSQLSFSFRNLVENLIKCLNKSKFHIMNFLFVFLIYLFNQ